MKSIFYLDNITCALSHKLICNKLKNINTVNDVYYNHLFSSFFIDYENEEVILNLFKTYKLDVIKHENINDVIDNFTSKESTLKLNLIILLVLLIIQIINLFINKQYLYQSIIGLIISIVSLYLSQSLLNKKYNDLNIYDDSTVVIMVIILSLLYGIVNLKMSFTFITFILTSLNIYKYLLSMFRKKLFEKDTSKETIALIKRDNVQLEVKPHEIKPNDIVIVKDKYTLPVDGVIIDGFTQVDQSMFTSEIPVVNKTKNESVVAGMINQNGYIEYRATSTKNKNTLNKRDNLILNAVSSKNNLGSSLNIFYDYFPKIILIISITLFIFSLIQTKQIIIPLSILLSLLLLIIFEVFEFIVPLNLLKLITSLSKDGVLIKSSNTIEKINECEVVMIEKSGVLIEEYPDVKDVFILEGVIPSDFYHIAYILTKDSNTRYATTIKNYLKNVHLSSIDPQQFQSSTRNPISKEDIHKDYNFVNYENIRNKDIDLSKVESSIKRFLTQGKNSIIFTHKKKIIGILTIQNILRDNVVSTLEEFKKLNKKIILLDKGEPDITKYYAHKLNIDEYHCNLSNLQKSKLVDRLYADGLKTIYISDINKTKKIPENTEINISINSDINFDIHNADIIIVKPNISDVLKIMNESKNLIKNINTQISLFIQIYGSLILLSLLSYISYLTPYLIEIIIYLLSIYLIRTYTETKERA